MRPRLFIGIPCYQESESLKRAMESIGRTTGIPHELEVHVAKQSVVRNKNELLKKARASSAEYVCLCDDDVEPKPGWAETLIQGVEDVQKQTGRHVGQTTPLVLYPDGSVWGLWANIHCSTQFNLFNLTLVAHGGPFKDEYRAIFEAAAVTGTLTVFTRKFLERVHWEFDDRYEKSQFEDVDQSLTCRSEGFLAVYNGHATVIHHQQGVTPRATENYQKLVNKWRHRPDLSLIVPPDSAAISRAQEQLFTPPGGVWTKVGKVLSFCGKHPLSRMSTAVQIVRKSGLSALWYECRTKMKGREYYDHVGV